MQVSEQVSEQVREPITKQVTRYQNMVKKFCVTPKSAKEIREFLGIKSRNYVAYNIIKPLVDNNVLKYTNKKHTNASNQKYVIINKNM